MKKYSFKISGNKYDVEIQKVEGNIIELEVNGLSYKIELEQAVEQKKTPILVRQEVAPPTTKEKKIQKTLSSAYPVKSPLPGIIIKVNVKEGDSVKEGDTVVTIEAMKMENKILAEKSGTVKSVRVKPGDSVLENDILLELE